MEKVKKIIEVLDTQTPQILIESKIVEVNERFSQEIGLRDGINFGFDPIGSKTNTGKSSIGVGSDEFHTSGPGFTFSSAPGKSGDTVRNALSLSITRFSRVLDLNFTLQLMEAESKGRVVSNPKVITQNRKKANLTSTKTTSFPTTVTDQSGNITSSFESIDAKIDLDVTPQVTNEGSIILDIAIAKEDFGDKPYGTAPPDKTQSSIKTNVLVESGSTVVLGGLYEYKKTVASSGVPFLKDLPMLGWLFRTLYAPFNSKREVIIFITPRIMNKEEAGIADSG